MDHRDGTLTDPKHFRISPLYIPASGDNPDSEGVYEMLMLNLSRASICLLIGKTTLRGNRLFATCFAMLFLFSSQLAMAQVAFDVNPFVPARDASNLGLMSQVPNSRMIDVQLDVSALFTPGDASIVTEYTVRIVSRHEDVLVADYSPRTEMQTDVFGPMQVAQDSDRLREAAIRGVGGYPGVGSAQGYAFAQSNEHETVHYARKPAMELLTAAGTLERRRGVYFKMRQSPQTTLEGARPFRIVFEVPNTWRADLLDVTIEAVGYDHGHSKRTRVLSTHPFVVALYQENDEYAASVAANYVRQQQNLNSTARSFARTIEQRSFPTPIHKLGAKLDIYEPSIPQDWFASIVFQPGNAFHSSKLSYLPVDVRVAIMNYLDQKNLMETMSGTQPYSTLANRGVVQPQYVRQ